MTQEQSPSESSGSWVAAALALGAALGFVISPWGQNYWSWLDDAGQSLWLCGFGAGLGFIGLKLYQRYRRRGAGLMLEQVTAKVPGLGDVKLKIDLRQRDAGWRIFVELATRISTQKLEPGTGLIREALTSQYKLFELIRGELKSMPPDSKKLAGDEVDIEGFAIAVLNLALRPCLSRWHPLLQQWEARGEPESQWPLADACRSDLEATRKAVVVLTSQLGQALGLRDANRLLVDPASEGVPQLKTTAEVLTASASIPKPLSDDARKVGWRIYVELNTRIATQALADDSGLLREALNSLYALFGELRDELKALPGPSQSTAELASIEAVTLEILNAQLRPFLARWHPRLAAWEAENSDAPESDWPEAAECRRALAAAREDVAESMSKLGELLGCAGH